MTQSTIRNNKENILLLNDSVDLSKVISTLILSTENKIIQAETIGKALEILSQERIHLILLSADFNDQDVFESIRKLKLRSPFSQMILLADSINSNSENFDFLETYVPKLEKAKGESKYVKLLSDRQDVLRTVDQQRP